ncbi:bifunctional 2-polyprenyl-6-hydroxyphenol methylase/3-demethylubiquinol 3-O-methyltransferase UbiG [Bacteroides sp. 519]|uniref:class I SAM-dependent methyltransferase n=1 Tax=Bacteroides sp. 519 TaxID=2302937 RepID=UPI0013D7B094|nr:class I SAM-dependent methyltransferase [Bacteroides sp. 519]NDV57557.1 class I SAM-dependent methyltransferase [Bacteroides sp. 519]
MNKFNIKSCPLCNNACLEKELTCTDSFVSGEQFDVFCCKECGFKFTQNFPQGSEIDQYYNSTNYISHSDTHKGLVNRLYHRVRKQMLKKKTQLVLTTSLLKTGKLLDIGTGTGYFPAAMQKEGWDVEAIEKNEQTRIYAKEKFNLNVHNESALNTFKPQTFDVITLWHVMEHLENLDQVWANLHTLLKDTGFLIIAVPNCASYDAEYYKEQWAAYDVPRHLWHFTPATIQKWGAKHNFVLASRYAMPFDAFYISMLSEKNKGNSSAFIKGMSMGAWFRLKTLAKKDKSSSMIYIFRKKRNGK